MQFAGKLGTVQTRKPPSRVNDNAPVRMVKITGLAPDTSTTVIEMFVENKSGGSELESCDFDADIGVAVVGFKSPQGSINLPSSQNDNYGRRIYDRRTDNVFRNDSDGQCQTYVI